jgi:hypothetical protein
MKEEELGIFNLFTRQANLTSKSELDLDIGGRRWTILKQSKSIVDLADTYTCISYSWGTARKPNPLQLGREMSSRTIPVLETAIRVLENHDNSSNNTKSSPIIWIDTFCVSRYERDRKICLKNMGSIYANASKVLVVLSPSSADVLRQVRENDKINEKALHLLDKDDWAIRAWTYQEVVNSKLIYFISEGEQESPIKGHILFDAVSKCRGDFSEKKRYDIFDMLSLFPRLMSFESVLLDWKMGEYLKRSAYQVISSIGLRKAKQTSDLVQAMIGAITIDPFIDDGTHSLSQEEYFIQVCEEKNDFSFIYTTTKRSKIIGKAWRPNTEKLEVVFNDIHCNGEGQPGKLYPTYLQLDNVLKMSIGNAPEEKLKNLMKYIGYGNVSRNNRRNLILAWLKKGGFNGCGECIELEQGLFFSQEPIPDTDDLYAIISTGVKFAVIGSPGLLVKGTDTDVYHYCGPGVFFGNLKNQNTVSINVG